LLCRGARATSPTTPQGVVGKDASPPGDTHRGRATSPDPQPFRVGGLVKMPRTPLLCRGVRATRDKINMSRRLYYNFVNEILTHILYLYLKTRPLVLAMRPDLYL